ncbi:hypothetical protein B0H13DRAFT_2230806 [Mycena leptocephala]|nr:hypothetical protein B0H13DRAFT_2230806 [Mycena leptocephala]
MSDLYTSLQSDDDTTPKKLKSSPSHRITSSREAAESRTPQLPPHCRDFVIHTGLQDALSHALATCAVSPSSDTGIVRNVLNNLSLSAYSRLSTQFEVDDLRRLCWIWEWDGITLPSEKPAPKDWTRGAMGIVLSPATHRSRVDGKRVPSSCGATPIPPIPCADLPRLSASTKTTSLTRNLASFSRKSFSPFKLPVPPSSPSPLPSKSKTAAHLSTIPSLSLLVVARNLLQEFRAFSQTPSSRLNQPLFRPLRRRPQHTIFFEAQALYERLRQRSLSASPTKAANSKVKGGKLTSHQLSKMGQDELRRRCLLGRLYGVAASVWMSAVLHACAGSTASPSVRKRRALPMSEVAPAIVQSSPVPIASAEAVYSLAMLTKLCPFFLKQFTIGGEEWLEMPAGSTEGLCEVREIIRSELRE